MHSCIEQGLLLLVLAGFQPVLVCRLVMQLIGLHGEANEHTQAAAVTVRSGGVEVVHQGPDSLALLRGRVCRVGMGGEIRCGDGVVLGLEHVPQIGGKEIAEIVGRKAEEQLLGLHH
jgi:hypothetical protein